MKYVSHACCFHIASQQCLKFPYIIIFHELWTVPFYFHGLWVPYNGIKSWTQQALVLSQGCIGVMSNMGISVCCFETHYSYNNNIQLWSKQ